MNSPFFYAFGQGIRNIFRNKWYSLASLATISTCLFVFGIFVAVVFNVNHIVSTVEEGVSVTVYFNEGIEQERIDQIQDLVKNRPEVSRCDFISADEAWAEFSQKLGENAEGFTENPLANSENLQIYLSDVSKQAELVSYLETVEGIRKINKSELTANTLTGVNKVIAYVSIGMIVLLLAVSVFLISNTVTIGISVRKEEISIMKYVGATDWFIRWPFLLEGVVLGCLGGVVAALALRGVYRIIAAKIYDTLAFFPLIPENPFLHYVTAAILICGMLIGALGSTISLKRFLNA